VPLAEPLGGVKRIAIPPAPRHSSCADVAPVLPANPPGDQPSSGATAPPGTWQAETA
jgi:hypothetical protein